MKHLLILIILTAVTLNSHAQPAGPFDNRNVEVTLLDINTPSSEISPALLGNQLIYSAIPQELFQNQGRMRKNTAFYRALQIPVDASGVAGSAVQPLLNLGDQYHQGPMVWNQVKGELWVTLSNVIHPDTTLRLFSSRQNIRLRLAALKQVNGVWGIAYEFPHNQKDFHLAHPALSVTGDTLIFSSDMLASSQGQSDLFLSIRQGDSWSQPLNLGPKINTPGNEMFPTLLPGNILAFSSDGHPGALGQLDIYYTPLQQLTTPINPGAPLNSPYDDFGLTLLPSGNSGFFTSNRPGQGSDDIYRITLEPKFVPLAGRVIDQNTRQPIPGASITLVDCHNQVLASLTSDAQGNFKVEVPPTDCLMASAEKERYQPAELAYDGNTSITLELAPRRYFTLRIVDSETDLPLDGAAATCNDNTYRADASGSIELPLEMLAQCSFRIAHDGYLEQTKLPEAIPVENNVVRTIALIKRDIGRSFALENIYYDFDKWDILPESAVELDKLVKVMNDNPTLVVELGSHTDSRGRDAYNLWLSQQRSDSAVSYIVNNGIPRERIQARGYGETQLVNQCANGVQCTDQEHRQNRRTMIKILGY